MNNLSFSHIVLEKKKGSERGEILSKLLEEVNNERKNTKYKPMSMRVFAIKLSHLSLKDLYWLSSTCRDYKNRGGCYGKCIFGSIKVKP